MEEIILLAITVAAALVISIRSLRTSRIVKDTPTAKIRSAHQGYVELEGTARWLDSEIVSPLTGERCVWWSYTIQEKKWDGGKRKWKTVEDVTSDEMFCLEDTTGSCVIIPEGAQVVPSLQRSWHGRTPESCRTPWKNEPLGSRYLFTEKLLMCDKPLYALGQFETVAAEGSDRAVALQSKLEVWARDPRRMKIFDVNKSGKLDHREQMAMERMAEREVDRELLAAPQTTATLVKPTAPDQPFILSSKPQHQVLASSRQMAVIGYVWFVVGGALLVWLLTKG